MIEELRPVLLALGAALFPGSVVSPVVRGMDAPFVEAGRAVILCRPIGAGTEHCAAFERACASGRATVTELLTDPTATRRAPP